MYGVGDAIYKTVCPKCGAIRQDSQIGLEETPEEYSDTQWINIKDLDLNYVKKEIASSSLSKSINM